MKLPNAERAVIQQAKIVDYLLNVEHRDGGSKAKLLLSLGYAPANWRQLKSDLVQMHLQEDVIVSRQTISGVRYEIVPPLTGPSGDTVLFRSVWQIDLGTDAPRLVTMYPE